MLPRLGRILVKRVHWTLLLCLLGTVFLLALPPVDLPDTAFNELDTPVNVARPALPRVTLTAPAVHSVSLSESTISLDKERASSKRNERDVPSYHAPDLQSLLCTFLI